MKMNSSIQIVVPCEINLLETVIIVSKFFINDRWNFITQIEFVPKVF